MSNLASPKPDFKFERRAQKRGFWPVAGIDEAGRGPLAGPVAAAAVIFDPNDIPTGLNDSKLLKAKQREQLYDEIFARAIAVSVAFSSGAEIDLLNIRQATHAAMRRALQALAVTPQYVLIDGNDLPQKLACPGESIIKGDRLSVSIAAASIVAKVSRDRLMRRLCQHYPAYGFSQHVGYGTKAHLTAIAEHGSCPLHRLSFSPFKTI